MPMLAVDWISNLGFIFIAAGGMALYIASRAAADALTAHRPASPGWIALGQWMPIAAVAILAIVVNRPAIALGVIFSTSVATLSLATGGVALMQPPSVSPVIKKAWPMILPVALLAFIAGFRGELTIFHASLLALQGVAVLFLWHQRRTSPRVMIDGLRVIQLMLSLALAGIGAYAAVRGVTRASHSTEILNTQIDVASTGLLSAILLSPLLVLPILGSGIDLAHREQSSTAITSHVGIVLLNICALLPGVIFFSYWRNFHFSHSLNPELLFALYRVTSIPPAAISFPLAVWRVDVVVLIVFGLFLLPRSSGAMVAGQIRRHAVDPRLRRLPHPRDGDWCQIDVILAARGFANQIAQK